MTDPHTIDRREALRLTTILLGGVISAPTLAGFLAGCRAPDAIAAGGPPTLTSAELELVATIAEHIIPQTDTPGARGVGVHRFVDAMVSEYYPQAARQRFVDALHDVDARAQRAGARTFVAATRAQQLAILSALDREAYSSASRSGSAHFFRTMKELTLLGYYTSEVGATRELRYSQVPGKYEGCVPLKRIGRAWAT